MPFPKPERERNIAMKVIKRLDFDLAYTEAKSPTLLPLRHKDFPAPTPTHTPGKI